MSTNVFLAIIFPIVSIVDVACIALVFLVPTWVPTTKHYLGDWVVNLGLVFVAISICVLVAVAAGLRNTAGVGQITKIQALWLSAIGGYVLFVLVYIWNLIRHGI